MCMTSSPFCYTCEYLRDGERGYEGVYMRNMGVLNCSFIPAVGTIDPMESHEIEENNSSAMLHIYHGG
jgi:hypothetical protein